MATKKTEHSESSGATTTRGAEPVGTAADETSQGKTNIADSVVQKIAAIAVREVSGVYAVGGGMSRAFGALRERMPGTNGGSSATSGVAVEVGERQAAVDVDMIVEYGATIVELSRAVRQNVITSVQRMTGLEVTEVNIAVNDIHLPSDDEAEPAASRVE